MENQILASNEKNFSGILLDKDDDVRRQEDSCQRKGMPGQWIQDLDDCGCSFIGSRG